MPAQLTLDALADYYQASLTPVRRAVVILTKEGVINKKGNGRLEPSVKLPDRKKKRTKERPRFPSSLSDPLDVISNDLVRLSLEGEPVHLREEATAEKYRISRSVVRNMLHRLAGRGLLEHIPRRGWRIRPFLQEDMQAFIEIREVLELKALELAIPHLLDADLQEMLAGNQGPIEGESISIDNSLHAYIVEKADNFYIKDFFDRHGHYYGILFDWEDQDEVTALGTLCQHRDILNPLLAKDWSMAKKALSHHIRENHPILSDLQKIYSRVGSGK